MRALWKSRMVLAALGITAGYFLISTLAESDRLIEVMRALVVGMALIVSISYGPAIIGALRTGRVTRAHHLIAGIVITWASTLAASVWGYAWRMAGRPDWMVDHVAVGFIMLLTVFGGWMHINAIGALDEETPPTLYILLGTAVGIGVAISMTVFLMTRARAGWPIF